MKLSRARLVGAHDARQTLLLRLDITEAIETGRHTMLPLFDGRGRFKNFHVLKQEIARIALGLSKGNQQTAADLLGVNRNTLRKLIPPAERPRAQRIRRERPP